LACTSGYQEWFIDIIRAVEVKSGVSLFKLNLAQSISQKLADAAMERQRTQFSLKLGHDHLATPTVYFLAPDRQAPSGGRRVIGTWIFSTPMASSPASYIIGGISATTGSSMKQGSPMSLL
jgi:hypothetical protein